MKKYVFCFLLGCVVVMSGCQEGPYNFAGESENWYVNYQVSPQGERSEETSFKIQYIGEEDIPKEMEYSIERRSGATSGEDQLNEQGILKSRSSWCDNCSSTDKNQEMDAWIKWDGQKETIRLKPSNDTF